MGVLFKKKVEYHSENLLLLKEINKVKKSIDLSYDLFNQSLDDNLIECYIYQINAQFKRYDYLIKIAKSKNLWVNIHPSAKVARDTPVYSLLK